MWPVINSITIDATEQEILSFLFHAVLFFVKICCITNKATRFWCVMPVAANLALSRSPQPELRGSGKLNLQSLYSNAADSADVKVTLIKLEDIISSVNFSAKVI